MAFCQSCIPLRLTLLRKPTSNPLSFANNTFSRSSVKFRHASATIKRHQSTSVHIENNTASTVKPGKTKKRWRRVAGVIAAGGLIYVADREFNAAALTRTTRCAFYACLILADFKLNFAPGKDQEKIDALHERVAKRLNHVCVANGGLFIKLGQSIGIQAAILPKPYREAFATIFDAAPVVPYAEVEKVFKQEFNGKTPLDLFETFDEKPIASASIAQVHRANLRVKDPKTGKEELREVAVKVQKPAIATQIEYDMAAYHVMLYIYEWAFAIPCYFVAPYVAKQIRRETDFIQEAQNSERTAKHLANEPALRDKVFVPRVHWDVTSSRIMTADFVAGAHKISDREKIEEMGFKVKTVMDAMAHAFSAMIFSWGHVHCDPHPGNVLVRPNPANKSQPQIVIIDHGLYVDLSPSFRRQYSELWRALFVIDVDTIDRIAKSWGIANSNLFASATLLRPTTVKKEHKTPEQIEAEKNAHKKIAHQAQEELKERLRTMLENEALIPRELIFLTRSMRMIQAVNQGLGSPTNRINILAHWASVGLRTTNPLDVDNQLDDLTKQTLQLQNRSALRTWLDEKRKLWTFKIVLVVIDIGFLLSKVRQAWVKLVYGKEEGFEDLLQQQVSQMAKEEFGMDLDETAFSG